MEIKARKVRIIKTERKREEGEKRKKARRKGIEEEEEKKKKLRKKKIMNIKKIAKEWEIWDEEEEVARSKEKTKKLVPKCFHE